VSPARQFTGMKLFALVVAILSTPLLLESCGEKGKADVSKEAPPPAEVIQEPDANLVVVDKPDQFPLFTATAVDIAPELNATAAVSPDVSRQIPVISLAAGRVAAIYARLGDTVKKGQLLMKIQSTDISGAYNDYLKAVADEKLARVQLQRSRDLKERGAIAEKDVEVSENAEEDAKVTVTTSLQHLKQLGADPDQPSDIVEVRAPVSGVITAQNATAASGVGGDNQSNLFTISDLSQVWIICDVYENNLSFVKLGEFAEVHLAAYPNLTLRGRISDIGPILDPASRTAKVRLQVENPGQLRIGMFATATFHSLSKTSHAAVPATAILHLHDRESAYTPAGDNKFRRREVTTGKTLPGGLQEIISGLSPGDRVVKDALALQNTVEQ